MIERKSDRKKIQFIIYSMNRNPVTTIIIISSTDNWFGIFEFLVVSDLARNPNKLSLYLLPTVENYKIRAVNPENRSKRD